MLRKQQENDEDNAGTAFKLAPLEHKTETYK